MKRFLPIVLIVLSLPLLLALYAQPVMTPRVDEITGAQIGIDYAHHEIHEGDFFTAHWESPVATLPTNVGEETAVSFTTPAAATARIHMIVDVRADDASTFEIREAPTIVANQGQTGLYYNRHRAITTLTTLRNNQTPPADGITTYTVAEAAAANLAAAGAVLHSETIAIAAGPPFASVLNAQARGQREWILAPSTSYVVILTSLTANDTVHEISLNWYEHVDGDFTN